MKKVYIVEVESGSSEQNGAMVFDSAWSSLEAAQEYCQKFKRNPEHWASIDWYFEITEVELDSGG